MNTGMRGFASIALHNPKYDTNVGGALRAAQCFGVSSVALCGKRLARYATDVMKTERHIPILHCLDDIMSLCPHAASPVAVEIVPGATSLPLFIHPQSAYYIFGPEDGSIPTKTINRCRHVVQIPSSHCLNLAAAVNVLLYDRMAKRTGVKQ